MFRPSKRQRTQQKHAASWIDSDTLTAIPTLADGVVETALATPHQEDLFLERFEKELVQRQGFLLARPNDPEWKATNLLKSRIVVGTNACTRAMGQSPRLVVLIQQAQALPWIHIPVLAKKRKIPLVLLSTKASPVLSRLLRVRNVTVLAFLPQKESAEQSDEEVSAHKALDSFVDYILEKTQRK